MTRVSCSILSSPPKPAAWAWDYRSAVRLSNCTGGTSGLCPMYLTVRPSSSPCLRNYAWRLTKYGSDLLALRFLAPCLFYYQEERLPVVAAVLGLSIKLYKSKQIPKGGQRERIP